ncbi:MAG: hypothetical protein GDA50_00170 [Alphaproteobacteria bacterium GM202ARS2]|nr:hypothetical protein [Alphaproteobacteria bacterium GM202ARS2]
MNNTYRQRFNAQSHRQCLPFANALAQYNSETRLKSYDQAVQAVEKYYGKPIAPSQIYNFVRGVWYYESNYGVLSRKRDNLTRVLDIYYFDGAINRFPIGEWEVDKLWHEGKLNNDFAEYRLMRVDIDDTESHLIQRAEQWILFYRYPNAWDDISRKIAGYS